MSLLHAARLNGHEPYTYLQDVLERLPTQPASALAELLPYRWRPTARLTNPPVSGCLDRMDTPPVREVRLAQTDLLRWAPALDLWP